ncbi:MAG: (2Fe-2S)-binding protein [Cellulosilyticaceae bacterium]
MDIICLCKKISEKDIVDAVKAGATTVEEVADKTGATTGFCHGGRCRSLIAKLIEENQ